MRLFRNSRTLLLSILSGLVLGTFVILTIGSLNSTEHILNFAVQYSRLFTQTGKYVTAIAIKTEEVSVYEGYEDKHGLWHGLVRQDVFSIEDGKQLSLMKSRMRHGVRHGITEAVWYKNDKPWKRSVFYYEDGKIKWAKGDQPLLKKHTKDISDAYAYFHNHFPLDECLLHAIGYDTLYLKDFFNALELELYAETFEAEDFDDHYEAALEVLEETLYDSIVNDNEALTLLNGFQIVKHHPFRLAVIDSYQESVTQSMKMLESRYSGFISDLEEADISQADLSEFCRQFDSCMASYGNLDLEDPYLIDSIDNRIYRGIFALYESGEEDTETALKLAVGPGLMAMSGMRYMRVHAFSVLHDAVELADTPGVAEVILYTIFMSYLEGDLIKKSVWEAWVRNNELIIVPEVGTGDLKGLTASSANLAGYIFFNGGEPLLKKGVAWGESYDPTVEMNSLSSSVEADSFNLTFKGLEEGKQYYARAFATNSQGTAYGSSLSFIAGEISGVHFHVNENGGLRVYPNPASDRVSLNFILEHEAQVEISIYGMDGREVYHDTQGLLSSGENFLELDLTGMTEGVYICQLSGNGSILYKQKLLIAP